MLLLGMLHARHLVYRFTEPFLSRPFLESPPLTPSHLRATKTSLREYDMSIEGAGRLQVFEISSVGSDAGNYPSVAGSAMSARSTRWVQVIEIQIIVEITHQTRVG
jgi:hypothetical protein